MTVYIKPNWPLADNVHSLITTRLLTSKQQSVSSIYGDFNLGDHVGDAADVVASTRQQLMQEAKLPAMPAWQQQVHGTQVQVLGETNFTTADASYTNQATYVCAMMTADCLPVLLADTNGKEIAAVHAGWRGLLAGVIENTLSHFSSQNIMAYLGPAISQANYQVGKDVYNAFTDDNIESKAAFIPDSEGKYKMDIYTLAKQRLYAANVAQVYGGDYCTYAEERFYSYRQACHEADGRTGRMASLIWRSG